MKAVVRGLVSQPYLLWLSGVQRMKRAPFSAAVLLVWTLVLAAVLLDGVSTYLLLHPSMNGTYGEGNPGARAVMDVVGLNGWIFVGNILCLFTLPAALLGVRTTAFQHVIWWGGALTVLGKILSGSWNAYLYLATS